METRKGLPLREMNDAQRTAAMGLMAAILSESGFRRAVDIMAYEAILLELEGPSQAKRRDYQKFYFAVYGNPEPNAPWGISVEGHHLSINMTYQGDTIVDSTPQFFGVNPARLLKDFETPDPLQSGSKTKYTSGTRLLLPEEQAAYDLLNSLSKDQQSKAIFDAECPADIQWAGEPQPKNDKPVGIHASSLQGDQKGKLKAILDVGPEAPIQKTNTSFASKAQPSLPSFATIKPIRKGLRQTTFIRYGEISVAISTCLSNQATSR